MVLGCRYISVICAKTPAVPHGVSCDIVGRYCLPTGVSDVEK